MIVFEPLEVRGHGREKTNESHTNLKQDFISIKTKFEDSVNKILEMKIWKKFRQDN